MTVESVPWYLRSNAEQDQLTDGRTATCDCGAERPSSNHAHLHSFEYQGEGCASPQCGVCGYRERAHDAASGSRIAGRLADHDFVVRLDEQDAFYCGHAGWE